MPVDKASAIEWFRKAAERGHADAQDTTGLLCADRDAAVAVVWFRKAAEQGHTKAQYNLGCAYYNGHGVPVDKAVAAELYRRAAELGYAKAQYSLGRLYCKGEGVPLDDAAGFEWNRMAAQQGYERARSLPASTWCSWALWEEEATTGHHLVSARCHPFLFEKRYLASALCLMHWLLTTTLASHVLPRRLPLVPVFSTISPHWGEPFVKSIKHKLRLK